MVHAKLHNCALQLQQGICQQMQQSKSSSFSTLLQSRGLLLALGGQPLSCPNCFNSCLSHFRESDSAKQVRVLGARATQISMGSRALIVSPSDGDELDTGAK
eukprot:4829273-Amphidinium_carterae.1